MVWRTLPFLTGLSLRQKPDPSDPKGQRGIKALSIAGQPQWELTGLFQTKLKENQSTQGCCVHNHTSTTGKQDRLRETRLLPAVKVQNNPGFLHALGEARKEQVQPQWQKTLSYRDMRRYPCQKGEGRRFHKDTEFSWTCNDEG